jgi:hypothetical protein
MRYLLLVELTCRCIKTIQSHHNLKYTVSRKSIKLSRRLAGLHSSLEPDTCQVRRSWRNDSLAAVVAADVEAHQKDWLLQVCSWRRYLMLEPQRDRRQLPVEEEVRPLGEEQLQPWDC